MAGKRRQPRKRRDNTTGHSEVVMEDRKAKEVVHEERKQWIFETRSFPDDTPPIYLDVRLGLTKNLGDYESARMDVGVSVACLPEEVPEYFAKAKKWITGQLSKEVRKIDKDFVDGY